MWRMFAVGLFLWALPASAQDVKFETESRLRVTAVGDADVWIWTTPPTLKVQQQDALILVEGPAGKYRLSVLGLKIDWEQRKFSQVTGSLEITLGGSPVPPDPDDPVPPGPSVGCTAVPGDVFDNIGQRACGWVETLVPAAARSDRKAFAQAYSTAIEDFAAGKIITITDCAAKMRELAGKIPSQPQWKDWGKALNEDVAKRWPMNRDDYVAYHRALVKGLSQ